MTTENLGDLFEKNENNFNFLRLFAALMVIYGHTSAVTGNGPQDIFLQYIGFKFIGGIAVDVFFLISGFLITASAIHSKSLKYYIVSRIFRIYPALIICVIILVFIIGPILTTNEHYWNSSITWNYFLSNASSLSTEYFLPGVFESNHDKAVNGSLWSLPIELRLYGIILIFAFLRIVYNKRLFNIVLFSIFTIGFLDPSFFDVFFKYPNHKHVAMMFLLGSFIYINRYEIKISPIVILSLLLFAAMTHGTVYFIYAYILLLPVFVFSFSFSFFPALSLFRKIKDYSYGVYLYGWVVQQLVYLNAPDISNSFHTIISMFFSLLLAILSWHLIESKALSLKSYIYKKNQGD